MAYSTPPIIDQLRELLWDYDRLIREARSYGANPGALLDRSHQLLETLKSLHAGYKLAD